MAKQEVFIGLLEGRAEVRVCRGRAVLHAHSMPMQFSSEIDAWKKEVEQWSADLAAVIAQWGLQGCPASVLYAGSSQAVCMEAVRVSRTIHACEAAKMSCLDSLQHSASSAVTQAVPVGRDRSGEKRQIHVVAAADRQDVVEQIAASIENAGLRFRSAVPIDALLVARISRQCLDHCDEPCAHYYIGEGSSFLAVGTGGAMALARQIGLGVASFVSSLTRPIRIPGREETVTLTEQQARDIIDRYGLADPGVELDEFHDGLRGSHLMPVIQPVLQRMIVELRQTMRFGLSDQPGNLSLRVSGPGGGLPHLAERLAAELSLPLDSAPAADSTGHVRADILDDAMEDAGLLRQLVLQPPQHAHRQWVRVVQHQLWGGAAVAACLIGFDAMRYHSIVTTLRDRYESVQSRSDEVREFGRTQERLQRLVASMDSLQETIEEETGHHFDAGAALNELTHRTPDGVRLSEIAFRRSDHGIIGVLNGHAMRDGRELSQLNTYIDSLHESLLFDDVILGSVRLQSLEGRPAERFDATFKSRTIPQPAAQAIVRGQGE